MEDERLYDDNAFQVFSIALLFVVAAPWTIFYLWGLVGMCRSDGDVSTDGARKKKGKSKRSIIVQGIILMALWGGWWYLTTTVEVEGRQGFNPFEILEVAEDATPIQIKSAYRALSRKYHPDKNFGDKEAADKMVDINKAYEILSDEKLREEWELHGTSDGPRKVGIGLPEWMLAEDSKYLVVTAYVIFLVVLVPIIVCVFYCRNKKMGAGSVKKDTYGAFVDLLQDYSQPKHMTEILSLADEFKRLPFRATQSELGALFKVLQRKISLRREGGLQQPYNFTKLKKFEQNIVPVDKAPKKVEGQLNPKFSNCVKANVFLLAYLCRVDPESDRVHHDIDLTKAQLKSLGQALIESSMQKSRKYGVVDPSTLISAIQYHQHLVQAVSPFEEGDAWQQVPCHEKMDVRKYAKKGMGIMKTIVSSEDVRKAAIDQLEDLDDKKTVESYFENLPDVTVDIEAFVDGTKSSSLFVGDIGTIKVTITRNNVADGDSAPLVHAPYYPDEKSEVWHVFAEGKETLDIDQMKRAREGKHMKPSNKVAQKKSVDSKKIVVDFVTFYHKFDEQKKVLEKSFKMPLQSAGKKKMKVHILCDSYLGFDIERDFEFTVKNVGKEGRPEDAGEEEGAASDISDDEEGEATNEKEEGDDVDELSDSDSESEDEKKDK